MSEEIKEILEASAETIAGGRGILSRLWRLSLSYVKVSYNRWEILMDNFTDTVSDGISPTTAQNLKGNLLRALCNEDITWAVFVKGLLILNFKNITLDFTFKRDEETKCYVVDLYTMKEASANGDPFTLESVALNVAKLKGMWCTVKDDFTKTKSWSELLDAYSVREYERLEKLEMLDKQTPSSLRSGINKNLSRDEISWRSFVDGLSTLGIDQMLVTIHFKAVRSLEIKLQVDL